MIECLQKDLDNISQWCADNYLKLNPIKTELLSIYTKPQLVNSLYKINNCNIKAVEEHKHLGIILDNKLNFNANVEMIITKSLKKWGILKYLCKNYDSQTFLLLYKTFILPILEHSNVILR